MIYHRYICISAKHHTANVEMIYRQDVGTIFAISRRHTVPLKGKLTPSRETRLASLETSLRRVSREMRQVSFETTRLVSRECTGSTNTSLSSIFKPVLCIIVPICAVSTIFILISDACVRPCVYKRTFFVCKPTTSCGFLRSLALGSYMYKGTRTSLQ